ncbi:hypothetical protein EDB81DRAFT_414331 [Dactylonectria macrodidyma]|uniref:Uncharacterized protein n=1 Tax=Dactylonectria macrodidyma TaxID=307937 RepID=A0A9P9F853_9HYPO|nr:hypothetical protein EDB81DRAFT_414331 [Dactylonectria macrodidyma]
MERWRGPRLESGESPEEGRRGCILDAAHVRGNVSGWVSCNSAWHVAQSGLIRRRRAVVLDAGGRLEREREESTIFVANAADGIPSRLFYLLTCLVPSSSKVPTNLVLAHFTGESDIPCYSRHVQDSRYCTKRVPANCALLSAARMAIASRQRIPQYRLLSDSKHPYSQTGSLGRHAVAAGRRGLKATSVGCHGSITHCLSLERSTARVVLRNLGSYET